MPALDSQLAQLVSTDPDISYSSQLLPVEPADATSIERALRFLVDGTLESPRKEGQSPPRAYTSSNLPHTLTGRIPFEVVELMIDKMTQGCLNSCALVCRAWYRAAIRVIYIKVSISSYSSFNSLAAFVRKDARAEECLAQTCSLRISGGNIKSGVPAHVVPLIFARLMQNVQRLAFYSSLNPLMHPSFFVTLPVFRAVTELELVRFKVRCFSELRRIISAFPRLRSLKLCVGSLELDSFPGPYAVAPTRMAC
ncbi:hypothetical protein DAEQUDRAFT_771034 [Daedalea quercina L-15889]|uniref:F-box domain-containing protein n=1 Tax=Daedalea quercina L-15889 TaxID=1314783 RepID=A0A165KEC2_9APHY|nr:hypothetical protein DAEQUDRAFT_771034 [Daedalea quercina L-15889]